MPQSCFFFMWTHLCGLQEKNYVEHSLPMSRTQWILCWRMRLRLGEGEDVRWSDESVGSRAASGLHGFRQQIVKD
jgi:hypothetical protein